MTALARFVPFALAACLVTPAALADEGHASAPPAEDFAAHVPGATELEGRVIAPCCWNQTIDIHGSESSSALRREIRARLRAGETQEQIEKSLIERYGPKIMAVPEGSRLGGTGVVLAIALGVAGVGAASLLRRWKRRSDDDPDQKPAPHERDALDDRLDAELARLDGE